MEYSMSVRQPSKSPISMLPPELFGSIIEHLHPLEWEVKWVDIVENKRDLHNCSFVSRAWNACLRPHLFRDITYSFRRPATEENHHYSTAASSTDPYWVDFCDARRDARHKTFAMFVAFLRDNPPVQRYIRRLKLDNWPMGDPSQPTPGCRRIGWALKEADHVDPSLFAQLLRSLPALQVLHLYNVILRETVPYNPAPCHPLRRLHIASYACKPFGDSLAHSSEPQLMITNLLSHFSSVNELQISAMHLHPSPKPLPLAHVKRLADLRVHSLILDSTHVATGFSEALASAAAMKTIERLIFFNRQECGGYVPGLPLIVLAAMAPHITQFRYNIHRGPTFDVPLINLSSWVNLQELTIGVTIRDHEDDHVQRCARNVVELVGHLEVMPYLNEVVLEFTFLDGMEPALRNKDHYQAVDGALSTLIDRSPALRGISVEIAGHEETSEFAATVKQLLPGVSLQEGLWFRPLRPRVWQEYE